MFQKRIFGLGICGETVKVCQQIQLLNIPELYVSMEETIEIAAVKQVYFQLLIQILFTLFRSALVQN